MKKRTKSLSGAQIAWVVLGLFVLFLIILISEAAFFQWIWNDFFVTHTHHLLARTGLGKAILPVFLINWLSGSYQRAADRSKS